MRRWTNHRSSTPHRAINNNLQGSLRHPVLLRRSCRYQCLACRPAKGRKIPALQAITYTDYMKWFSRKNYDHVRVSGRRRMTWRAWGNPYELNKSGRRYYRRRNRLGLAWHLAKAGVADDTVVIEPDPTYEFAATPRPSAASASSKACVKTSRCRGLAMSLWPFHRNSGRQRRPGRRQLSHGWVSSLARARTSPR